MELTPADRRQTASLHSGGQKRDERGGPPRSADAEGRRGDFHGKQELRGRDHACHPVGGSGSQLWPLLRPLYSKQFLPLASELTMIQETALRVAGEQFAALLVIYNEEHRFIMAKQLRANAVRPAEIILEPIGRSTAPAACVAVIKLLAAGEEALMLVMPSDHVIAGPESFLDAVSKAADAAPRVRLEDSYACA